MSLSLGQVDSNSSKYLFDINRLDQDILADDSERVWDTISTSSGSGIIGNINAFFFQLNKIKYLLII